MLEREAGHGGGQERIVYVELGPQPIGEPRLFYGDGLADEFQLFPEGNFIHTMSAQRRSQHFAQLFDDAHGGLTVVVTHEHRDSVERVEEEVRIHLRLKRGEARVREPFGKTGQLRVALARFDEVTNCMLNADDAEVDGDAERQRDEYPAQPVQAYLMVKLSILHRRAQSVRI